MTATTTRWAVVACRKEGAQGRFENKIFECTVPVTGSHDLTVSAIIASVRAQGYETSRVVDHASRREFL